MEKEVREIIKTERITHQFYCDGCGVLLGQSIEYDDGYYDCLGRFEQSFCLSGQTWSDKSERYTLKKCFCDNCREMVKEKIRTAILELGFEKER